jgi:peroxiredoxin family protein
MTKKKDAPPKQENLAPIIKERLVHLKHAQIYHKKGEIPKAVDRYKKYLHCLSLIHKTPEEKLSPNLFDKEKDLTELFLISHCYWDLAKAYDRAPSLKKESKRCLDQFIKFTVGFKYQHVNYRMIKKYMRKKMAHNPEQFAEVIKQLKVETKGCFIASHVFGYEAPETNALRKLKPLLLKNKSGEAFVDLYYDYSPVIVSKLKMYPNLNTILQTLFFRPLLLTIIKLFRL